MSLLAAQPPTQLVSNQIYQPTWLILTKSVLTAEKAPNCNWLNPMVGKYISGNDKVTMTGMDLEGCKKACEDATSFLCRSFDMTGTTCYLGSANRGTASLTSHASYTYYERDCSSKWTRCNMLMPLTMIIIKLCGPSNASGTLLIAGITSRATTRKLFTCPLPMSASRHAKRRQNSTAFLSTTTYQAQDATCRWST